MAPRRHMPGAATFLPDFEEGRWAVRERSGRLGSLPGRAIAWLRRPWLDAAIARDDDVAASSALERRAAALTSRRSRGQLARELRQSCLTAAERFGPRDARVPADPAEVVSAAGRLHELDQLLLGPAPVYCRSIVLGRRLLSDGSGPLYAPRFRGLAERLGIVLAALGGEELLTEGGNETS